MKTKEQKKAILERLNTAFKSGMPAVFVHFKGVTVADESAMRKSLKGEGISYFVAKKTLIGKALTDSAVAGTAPALDGEVAVAYATGGDDETLPARAVHAFSKKFGAERFAILGGIFEKALQGRDAIVGVATIPPLETLRGMFANIINSPRQRFAIALSEVAKKK
ncbi:50S ribosomal protein L10 [Candidatus Kaiserbacteria bacterium]|nr:50S ribosomal protein L10 [Candidatus Kaiserbacteria bacterium]